jgi:7,8-dihydropterin-6-yl-methyl-4-(beta-D-ribofuranosyl)aminobenzene 5'-phosphate synthase
VHIQEVDKVEIVTLQDNFIDLVAMDGNEVVQRAVTLNGFEIGDSVLAEHGFSSFITITAGGENGAMLFDFGYSEQGAAYNARTLGIDMNRVQAMVLSHGHMDHFGGLGRMADMFEKDRSAIEFVVHPDAFLQPRYLKYGENLNIYFPKFSRDLVLGKGFNLVETKEPRTLLDGKALFLGEIPRKNDFEKGFPLAHYTDQGIEKHDPILDDTSVVMNLKGKGLIILSGCAHAGIINTVEHAMSVTGITQVHAVMGGFHLSGPLFEPIIGRTIQEFKRISPRYIVPTHCTGRTAIMGIEREMPDRFLLNMSGTKMVFTA